MTSFVPPVAPLFVPASRPDRFGKAAASGADAIIIDLEDAVAPADKEGARDALLAHAGGLDCPVIVRINAAGNPWHEADLDAIAGIGIGALMLPKAERPEDVANAVRRIGRNLPVVALVETAAGLARLADILSAEHVALVAFGSIDFALDLGCAEDRQVLLPVRSEIVWRSRAANRAAPLDGVTAKLDDLRAVQDDANHAAMLGFGGKLAVHPKQIEPIRLAFRPDDDAVEWARNVLAAVSSGQAARFNGEMIDRPVVERAERILARARR
jgi:citrate lyase subunit beta / citryl-CoA lyase